MILLHLPYSFYQLIVKISGVIVLEFIVVLNRSKGIQLLTVPGVHLIRWIYQLFQFLVARHTAIGRKIKWAEFSLDAG